MPGDVNGSLREGVSNSAPLYSQDLHGGDCFLVCCFPQFLICDLLWPVDTNDFAQAAIDESLKLTECCSVLSLSMFRNLRGVQFLHWC